MYFATVRTETLNPNFANSAWIRFCPHRKFSVAMRRMSAFTSGGIVFRPDLPRCRDRQRPYHPAHQPPPNPVILSEAFHDGSLTESDADRAFAPCRPASPLRATGGVAIGKIALISRFREGTRARTAGYCSKFRCRVTLTHRLEDFLSTKIYRKRCAIIERKPNPWRIRGTRGETDEPNVSAP